MSSDRVKPHKSYRDNCHGQWLVTAMVNEEEYNELSDTAELVGQSVSNLIRDALSDRIIYLRGYLQDVKDGRS